MAKVVGDVAVKVSADIGPLQKGLKRGARDLDDFGTRAKKMAGNVAKAGVAITAGLAAAGAAGYGLARSAASAGAEIERLSTIAGVSPEKFQRLSAATKTVGIEQDKLADILKDMQDRIGDFIATGGGPMADFFENIAPLVGVTAENFRDLNGADALQLYVSSLQKAGVSQNEMAFYLEAMASDLTALLPLLADGGAEMKRLGDEAAEAGAILSNEAVNGSKDLLREFDTLETAIRNKVIEAILENKDAIINDWLPATIQIVEGIGKIVGVLGDLISALGAAADAYDRFISVARGADDYYNQFPALPNPADQQRINDETRDWNNGQGDPSQTGTWDQSVIDAIPSMNFAANAEAFEIEQEQLEEHQEILKEIIRAGQEGQFEVLSEGYANRLKLAEDYSAAAQRVEEMSQSQKMTAIKGAFGDLATLMSSENEKLFKIGKAAAIAEAVVSGYKAAVAAWEKGMDVGGPPVAAAFTAASLARTGGLISQIASQQIGGSSGSGGGGGGGGASQAATSGPAPIEARILGVNPGQMYSGAAISGLVDDIMDEIGDRGVRLVVAQ